MLQARSTKFGAGITIGGDRHDLAGLRETVLALCDDGGPLSGLHGEFVLALAYDLRKAAGGHRQHWDADAAADGYLCVDVLWPIFLFQLGMLRAAASYRPTGLRLQANLYALEACTSEALQAVDGAVAGACMSWLASFSRPPETYLTEHVVQLARQFVAGPAGGKSRMKRLPTLLQDLWHGSASYIEFERRVTRQAEQQGVRVQELHDLSEWPEFKW